MQIDLEILTWIANGLSLCTAFLLSRGGYYTRAGRYVGMASATVWLCYGMLAVNWSFIIADAIFIWIYVSAVLKFDSKKQSYRKKIMAAERLIKWHKRRLKNEAGDKVHGR